MTSRLTLLLILSLAPAAAQAQPPPARKAQVSARSTVARQSPILATSLRQKDSRIVSAKRLQPRRVRVRVVSQPNPLHVLASSLLSLPPPLPPALVSQPTPPPSAIRQLQYQFELLHVRSPR